MYLLYAIPVVILLVVAAILGGGALVLLPVLIGLLLIAAYLVKAGVADRPDEVPSEPTPADQPEAPTPERGGVWGERST